METKGKKQKAAFPEGKPWNIAPRLFRPWIYGIYFNGAGRCLSMGIHEPGVLGISAPNPDHPKSVATFENSWL